MARSRAASSHAASRYASMTSAAASGWADTSRGGFAPVAPGKWRWEVARSIATTAGLMRRGSGRPGPRPQLARYECRNSTAAAGGSMSSCNTTPAHTSSPSASEYPGRESEHRDAAAAATGCRRSCSSSALTRSPRSTEAVATGSSDTSARAPSKSRAAESETYLATDSGGSAHPRRIKPSSHAPASAPEPLAALAALAAGAASPDGDAMMIAAGAGFSSDSLGKTGKMPAAAKRAVAAPKTKGNKRNPARAPLPPPSGRDTLSRQARAEQRAGELGLGASSCGRARSCGARTIYRRAPAAAADAKSANSAEPARHVLVSAACIRDPLLEKRRPGELDAAGRPPGLRDAAGNRVVIKVRPGRLERHGYSSDAPDASRRAVLRRLIAEEGRGACLSLFRRLVLLSTWNTRRAPDRSRRIREDAEYMKRMFRPPQPR